MALIVQTALRQASQLLKDGGLPEPRLTAELLLAHALHQDRAYLYAHSEYELSEIEWIHFGRYLHERLQGKPAQYITRTQEFYGRPFHVSPSVLIPRPETEHVIEQVLEVGRAARSMVDIGCGSGAIAVTLQLETGAHVVATDISEAALSVARENAGTLGAPVDFLCCDLAAALHGPFDLIASNPPYVPLGEIEGLQREIRDFEPHVALNGGPSGTEIYYRIVPEAERLLVPGGWLVMEIGYRSEAGVRQALGPRWTSVDVRCDLAGLPRVISARYLP